MTGLKVSAQFILLSALLQNLKQLWKDSDARWKVLEKFIRSTLYLTVFSALPTIAMCLGNRLGVPCNRFTMTAYLGLGGIAAFRFEPVIRHIQLLAFMLPKMIETMSDSLSSKGLYKPQNWHAKLILLFAVALFAYNALREHRKFKK